MKINLARGEGSINLESRKSKKCLIVYSPYTDHKINCFQKQLNSEPIKFIEAKDKKTANRYRYTDGKKDILGTN